MFKKLKLTNPNKRGNKNASTKQTTRHPNKQVKKKQLTSSTKRTRTRAPQQKPGGKIKIIPIGGVEFIGCNCTAIEYENEIIVIDAGIGFPAADQYGVDFLIPNPYYLRKNASKVKALIITHGHLDHIGAVPYMVRYMNFPPVYASQFATKLMQENLRMNFKDLIGQVKFKDVNRASKLKIGKLNIEFFGVNHSIPESMGVIVKSPVGNIVHTGDFKFDNSPLNEPQTEYNKIARIGAEGVLALLADSTNSYREGHSLSESEITKKLDELIETTPGRIIIATFASMVNRLVELLKSAEKYNRKVFVSGRSMENAIKIARSIGYLKVSNDLFIKRGQLHKYDPDKVMILATGSQGESLAALGRISRNEHKDVKIMRGDTVIMSASVIPGNGALVQHLIDQLSLLGANVYHNEIMNLHTTGHGHKEEQKLMINLVKPKFFIPVHGYQSFLVEHAKTAKSLGISDANIIIPQNGGIIELSKNRWDMKKKIDSKPIMVSGAGVGDVGDTVLEDRQQLANYGVLIYGLTIDKKTNKLLKKPEIVSRGFVYMKHSKELIGKTKDLIEETYNSEVENFTANEIREKIGKKLKRYLYKVTERDPMILSMIDFLE